MQQKRILIKDTDLKKDRTRDFYTAFLTEIQDKKLEEKVQLVRVSDIGIYGKGLTVRVLPENFLYCDVETGDISRIVSESVVEGRPIEALLHKPDDKQLRLVLRNCGLVDPESIDDYIKHDGYQAIATILEKMTPEKVIEEMKISELRGRGGAGFPTWLKWKLTRAVEADQKYVICNGDEGDPGAYMDRSVLEGDPHSVIEGMMIAAYVIGATKGFFYIRAEYPLAIERVNRAVTQAHEYGLLGENILGSSFKLDIEIRLGAGAFVCGEETALISSVEGKRGYPRPRPPYPSVKGLWGKPTVINNVETLANIPLIMLKGGKWFSSIGTEKSKGSKVFALTGKVKNSGLIEVPMGTTLKEIVFEIGGGGIAGKKVKAVQTGGPSGGVIPEDFINAPVGYESLQKLGSIMGSGGMIVMNEDDCMVDIAKFYLRFCVDESCGKCAPCRIGGTQLLHLLEKISEGKGEIEDLDRLRRISRAMQKAALCGLGQTAPNPVLSTLRYFEDEYKAHIVEKKCPAGRCAGLFHFSIIEEKCKRCGLCFRNCPVQAVSGNRDQGYLIFEEKCINCGRCFEVCKFEAVSRG
ncbi:MAG: NADH dehydrogenase [Omnitrophica bacterium RIFCSPLOWO2_12_FULL_44_17]|uniref:NADH dehydrogenase n=1 Tax=Candidatus Danuiimicrobium aquiferis TaxID=1801832 RepID=A0A1G1L328_9BACT|nr:MAG: NADH dehydrogenase [Omnitrophica bacterium RIFCSPHIGHO2_02_FULL_45_28]OGW91822.1 MAG: NADH dehydrogenase [Omnitrophica bacterium RIFCSPHIGHO2_12_FULL_44_12]OGW99534.1 MAG: NADH dehydrogenase [Omnitrophica bacterium RIFCSPLOWO2_12_FULL_44_17]OGX02705.1 MAG: NADH dehydrogenase [Omnitrophica bacterium RIFCSPLOWO2_02_FULL_44_11]